MNFEKIPFENAKEMRKMIDYIQNNVRALKVIKYSQNKLTNILLINILVRKLDRKLKENFLISHNWKSVPTFEEIVKYLELAVIIMEL